MIVMENKPVLLYISVGKFLYGCQDFLFQNLFCDQESHHHVKINDFDIPFGIVFPNGDPFLLLEELLIFLFDEVRGLCLVNPMRDEAAEG